MRVRVAINDGSGIPETRFSGSGSAVVEKWGLKGKFGEGFSLFFAKNLFQLSLKSIFRLITGTRKSAFWILLDPSL